MFKKTQLPLSPSSPPPPPREDAVQRSEGDGSSFSEVMEGNSDSSNQDVSTSGEGGSGGSGGHGQGHSGQGQGEGQSREGQHPWREEEMVIHEVDLRQKEAEQTEKILTFFQQPVFRSSPASMVHSLLVDVKNHTLPAMMLDKIVAEVQLAQGLNSGVAFHFELKGDVLGGLRLNISFEGQKIHAEFFSQHAEVQRMMSGQLDELRKRLMKRGLNVGRLEVRDPNEKRREQRREQHKRDREHQQHSKDHPEEILEDEANEDSSTSHS
ncbi:MAG: flagellar hook-length control protein FliK [Deltaproteobacteria bacterium]|nr:MAG: flagellar hook-length control protein FliK [Deltaproteobacteria bacterium]